MSKEINVCQFCNPNYKPGYAANRYYMDMDGIYCELCGKIATEHPEVGFFWIQLMTPDEREEARCLYCNNVGTIIGSESVGRGIRCDTPGCEKRFTSFSTAKNNEGERIYTKLCDYQIPVQETDLLDRQHVDYWILLKRQEGYDDQQVEHALIKEFAEFIRYRQGILREFYVDKS